MVPFYRRELAAEASLRVTALDGLRGILCFAVLFHHAAVIRAWLDSRVWSPPPSAIYSLLGGTAVAMFFCVTGFLFWSRALALGGRIEPVTFLRARVFRIAPLYLVSVVAALSLVADRIDWSGPGSYRGVVEMAALGLLRWTSVGSVPVWYLNAGVVWTLQYEWGFYLALPALAAGAKGTRAAVRVAALVVGLVVMFGSGPYVYFAVGAAAAHVARHGRAAAALRGRWASAVVAVVACALPLVTDDATRARAMLLTTVAFIPIACGNTVFGLLSLRGLRLMGIASYSVYLLHGIALNAAGPVLTKAAAGAPGTYWATATGVAVVVLVASLLTYRWVEWPAIRWERRLRRGPPTEAVVPAPGREPMPVV